MTPTLLIIIGLATWRLSSMLVEEEGPFEIFLKIRKLTGIVHDDAGKPMVIPKTFFAGLLSCVWCTSIWVAAYWVLAWYVVPVWTMPVALLCAGSAIAIIVDKIISQ